MRDDQASIFTEASQFAVIAGEGENPDVLTGYAVVWNQLSSDRGGYKVRMAPGSAKFAESTSARFTHENPQPIGTTENGSLKFTSDEIGVKTEILLPKTTLGRDVKTLVKDKYVKGMSFELSKKALPWKFTDGTLSPIKGRSRFSMEDGQRVLTITDALIDVVTVEPKPAFKGSSIATKFADCEGDFPDRTAQALQLERIRLENSRLPDAVA